MPEDKQNGIRIPLYDIARWVLGVFLSLVGLLATFALNRVTADIDEIKSDNRATAQAIASQNIRIAVIESTTKRTEALVEQEGRDLRSQNDRLSKVEGRCCK